MTRLTLFASVLTLVVALPAAGARAAAAPTNSSAPTISGQPYVGKTLTASRGGWSNAPTQFTYQWARCDSLGNNCAPIAGATTATYTPVSADLNSTLEVWVTAANGGGTTGPVNSKPTVTITPALPPSNTALPTVVGKPLVGGSLLANPGTYSGGAVAAFSYQWQSCDPASLICTDISGASAQSYTLVAGDVGRRLRVSVTADNPFGHATTSSAATEAVSTPVSAVTTTLAASTALTICCQVVHLSGTASPALAGEQITILAHQYGRLASFPVATAVTDSAGDWTAKVTPLIATSYSAQTTTSTSSPIMVSVHPRVGFGISGNHFSAKITALGSFAGKVAFFQQLSSTGSWHSLALVVINPGSVAHFNVALRRGRTYVVRIYLPASQAGPGYLDGSSHTRHVGGTAAL